LIQTVVLALTSKKISDDPDPETAERRPLPRYSAAIQEITEKTWIEGKGENARLVREIKLKLTSAKHAALETLRKHLIGDEEAELTPQQRQERLNYLLTKAGFQTTKASVH